MVIAINTFQVVLPEQELSQWQNCLLLLTQENDCFATYSGYNPSAIICDILTLRITRVMEVTLELILRAYLSGLSYGT